MRFARWLVRFAVGLVLVAGCGGPGTTDGGTDVATDRVSIDSRTDVPVGDTVPTDAPPDIVTTGEFGSPCARDTDCLSGICLTIGRCSRTCTSVADCPPSTNWMCTGLPGRGTVCDCTPSGTTDIACNNIDDDCNGQIDDTSRRCNGTCVDVNSDNSNCGSCGIVCGGGTTCIAGHCDCPATQPTVCGTRCVATQTDVANCGSCGHACAAGANGTPACVAGACTLTCNPGFGDCDGNVANGCESDTRSNLSNCGMCGHACTFANATGTCSTGSCVLTSCTAGFANCDGDPSNGCEATTSSDVMNCGSCGNRCMPANGVGACTASMCDLAACNPGYANCNTLPGDGCEAALATSVSNCGTCGHVCPSGANSTANCTASTCGLVCNPGFANCDGSVANGCEVSTASDSSNCGLCGNVCPSGQFCVAGVCSAGCGGMPGYISCGGVCVNPATSPNNCGGCGNICAAPRTCSAGTCNCTTGLTFCGATCVNTSIDVNNCGTCGNACAAGHLCNSGTCGCAAGLTDCGTSCANTSVDVNNCGTCGHACGPGATCSAGTCVVATGPIVACPADSTTPAGMGVNLTVTASSPGRTITGYNWTITSAPTGGASLATWSPMPPNAATERFTPSVIGNYTIHVVVTDSAGATGSCDTHVAAQSTGLRVEVTWDGTGDLDLHMHNNVTTTAWFTTPNDCYYANRNAAWDTTSTADDGVLDLDNTTSYGPELAHVTAPLTTEAYTIAVHNYVNGAGRIATVRIYCGNTSTPTQTFTSRALTGTGSGNMSTNDFWKVARVVFTSATACTITPINTYVTATSASTTF